VADDDRTSRVLLQAVLTQWGHEVELAEDGDDAWEVIQRASPQVAILDWVMPGLDGLEVCRRIRRDPVLSLTYVMLLTGCSTRENLIAGLDAGADDYLAKPFDREELRARLAVMARSIEAHRESERLLAAISSVLIGLDSDGRITRWNSVAEQTFLVRAEQALGRHVSDCGIRWVDAQQVSDLLAAAGPGPVGGELPFKAATGEDRLLGVTVTAVSHGADGVDARVVLAADVTHRRVLEAQLRQSQKLEGIGQLAAGIAHEINTPMQYIGDNVRYLGDSVTALEGLFSAVLELPLLADNAPREELHRAIARLCELAERADLTFLRTDLPNAVAQSLEGVEHVSRIVRAMKEFSHPGSGQKELVDLNHAIETTLVVARNEIKYVADVETALDPTLPTVPCLPGEINQVLLNLFINAAHAIGDVVNEGLRSKGTIHVSTRVVDGSVEIRIADTGRGIPENIRSRVFEPFFTTKDVGRGTGQGLAMAHTTIVGRHAGQLWFESVVGHGTAFFIRLPLGTTEQEETAA
jgi:signal transduction histidine kinase